MHSDLPVGTITEMFGWPCRVEQHRDDDKPRLYTYQPQRYTEPEAPVTGVSGLMPYKAGEKTRWYPCFATPDEAVAYIIDNGFHGDVQRYQITKDLVNKRKAIYFGSEAFETDNHPWLTAGVVRCVEPKSMGPDRAHAGILNLGPDGINKETVVYV